MQLKVRSRTGFLARLLILALFCLGFSAYFFYDGAVGYPAQTVRANKYLEFRESGAHDWREQWAGYAKEQGWSTKDPGAPKTEADIFNQYAFGTMLAPVGLLFLVFFFRAKLRWIELTETGLRTSWGQELTFDEILVVDKKLWKKKGIARVLYEREGRKRRLTLDDWKYETEPTQDVLWEVEEHLQRDQIINGIPEAEDLDEEEYEDEYDEQEPGTEEAEKTGSEGDDSEADATEDVSDSEERR